MPRVLLQLAGRVVLGLHALGALLWIGLSPRGFPLDHPGFWSGVGIPALVVLACLAGLVGGARLGRPSVVALPAAWLVAAGFLLAWFPQTGSAPAAVAIVAGIVLLGPAAAALDPSRRGLLAAAPAVLLAGALGAGMVVTQRGSDPSTAPDALTAAPAGDDHGRVATFLAGDLYLTLRPTLEFRSTSPDRFWTLFASHGLPPQPTCSIAEASGAAELQLDVRCRLDQDVYSHLNSYTAFDVVGHASLSVGFSPVPGLQVPVEPADYPFGRPATFAFRDAHGTFRVVRASDAEKGPFEELGSGPLATDEALTLTLYDRGAAVAQLRLEDFARHASTELSPTAGWGVPGNAIEFRRAGNHPSDRAAFWITLAGTSVGRGFQSVGHGAGEYRNRLTVQAL